ncbi:FMN-binding glutamate synthase family protein [Portibacter marinus]|uniref:FMN-binding glutamate synthase family protein n=1 Tax=Portibacter marinus TaxID=2898660 RepID=UPI001F457BFA|nr:FMN-binding glutamate synthase family protein [Portibacter marinus]
MRQIFIWTSVTLTILVIVLAVLVNEHFYYAFLCIGPLILLGVYDMLQTKHALMRNFPLVGRSRYILEWFRPKIYQYFIEPDHDGRPFSRINRSLVYSRAKNETSTSPFGTLLNVYDESYEWMNHSIAALNHEKIDHNPRVTIGGPDCLKPYPASIFNVSAMSFGSLSSNAIEALNGGAAIGGFAHNTGEGGISPYHDAFGGDLIYQIGTGYFGCRNDEGHFDPDLYRKRTSADNVKMVELKLSQGAKPGHGGILPASKATKEIAEIRNIEPGKAVLSPPYHTAFSTPIGLLEFIKKLRDLSGGKPIGFKLCIGHKSEFLSICKAMVKTGIKPDFISIDGGEGGTGAAPVEFSNSVGMPYKDGLSFAYNALEGFDLKKDIALIASGKIVSGFDIYRSLALGADLCYSARAMMMAVGCIQALECNKNSCPTGVATQEPHLVKGLVVKDKKERVAEYHKQTVNSFIELMAASGVDNLDAINRSFIYSRVSPDKIARYDQLYPYIPAGCLLKESTIPVHYKMHMDLADENVFMKNALLEKMHL